jgi:P-type Cu+ transporter
MSEPQQTGEPVYTCPMHKDVRQAGPGKCPHCGMALLMAAAMMMK